MRTTTLPSILHEPPDKILLPFNDIFSKCG